MNENAKKLEKVLKKHGSILICIKGSPDPDAIASSFAFSVMCEYAGLKTKIVSAMNLSLAQNRAFVKILDIPVVFKKNPADFDHFDCYAVMDHQSAAVENVTGRIPCAAHIDHHEILENDAPAEFRLLVPEAGSTCSLIAGILSFERIPDPALATRVATALMYGIQTDTDKYAHAGKIDYDALRHLSKFSDKGVINRISGIPLSEFTVALLHRAMENEIIYKDWLLAGVGYVGEADRDSIAIVADFLLKRDEVNTAVVFALVEKKNAGLVLNASLRTTDGNLDLNDIIRSITPYGGARAFKGAYQVELGYFSHCPDRALLWEAVKVTTIDILRKKRDSLPIAEIRSAFRRFRKRLADLFSG